MRPRSKWSPARRLGTERVGAASGGQVGQGRGQVLALLVQAGAVAIERRNHLGRMERDGAIQVRQGFRQAHLLLITLREVDQGGVLLRLEPCRFLEVRDRAGAIAAADAHDAAVDVDAVQRRLVELAGVGFLDAAEIGLGGGEVIEFTVGEAAQQVGPGVLRLLVDAAAQARHGQRQVRPRGIRSLLAQLEMTHGQGIQGTVVVRCLPHGLLVMSQGFGQLAGAILLVPCQVGLKGAIQS